MNVLILRRFENRFPRAKNAEFGIIPLRTLRLGGRYSDLWLRLNTLGACGAMLDINY
jgi:hypothetical protein